MRKILIPTDFSDNAFNAMKYALELFKYDTCVFYIMHAYQDDIYASGEMMSEDTLTEVKTLVRTQSDNLLEDTVKKIKTISQNPRHSYHTIAADSMLIDEADRIVDEENIDLIVMGTRGKTNDRNLTFGSNTLQVLRYVQCPVLAIPEHFSGIQPRHILFPTNYLIPYKRRELKLLCELAVPYRSAIDLLYISKTSHLSMRQKDNQKFITDELSKNEVHCKTVDDQSVTNAIYSYIKAHDVDMLVMVNTRHSFLENILYQSTIDEMSLYLEIPFLALQNIRRN